MNLIEFEEEYGEELKKIVEKIEIKTKLPLLITTVYSQMQKLFLLLKVDTFGEDRHDAFPFEKFKQFERLLNMG